MRSNSKIMKGIYLAAFLSVASLSAFSQGYTGIGTNTPQERLDVNGAIIVRSDAVSPTPVPGTIQYNTTDGYHEGYTSAGTWIKLENENTIGYGDYITVVETCTSPATVGSNEYTTPSTGYFNPNYEENPFSTWWMDDRTQLLYKASQLTAAGICAGNINAIGFNVVTPGAYAMTSLTIKMKSTNITTLTAYETALSTVYSAGSYTPVVGANDFTLTSPFYWNGTDNIVIEVCFNNSAWAAGCTVTGDMNVGYQSAVGYYADIAAAGLCSDNTTYFTDDLPQLRVIGYVPTPTAGTGSYIQFSDAVVIGNPTLFYGGDYNGPGTLTVLGAYDDNTLISDYVFDEYFDGKISVEDIKKHDNYKRYSISEMSEFVEKYRHLPTIEGRDAWEEKGGFSLGELLTQLWVTAENQAIYISELNTDLKLVEQDIINNQDNIRASYNQALNRINSDALLSEEVKAMAVQSINDRLRLLELLINAHKP